MSVTIEKASIKDIDKLYEIEKQCFQRTAFTKQQITYLLTDSDAIGLVSLVKGEIVGFVIGIIHKKKSIKGHILTIDVLPTHRRRGIGLSLLQTMEKAFKDKNAKICHLEVRENNIEALNLYEKSGYKKIGKLHDYYPNAHGILLEKTLTQPP